MSSPWAIFDIPAPRSLVTLRSVSDEGSWATVAGTAMVLPEDGARFLAVARNDGIVMSGVAFPRSYGRNQREAGNESEGSVKISGYQRHQRFIAGKAEQLRIVLKICRGNIDRPPSMRYNGSASTTLCCGFLVRFCGSASKVRASLRHHGSGVWTGRAPPTTRRPDDPAFPANHGAILHSSLCKIESLLRKGVVSASTAVQA